MKHGRLYSNPTQVFWACKALLDGDTISHEAEIAAVKGWRLAAIIHALRNKYDWPILAEYRGPENIAFYWLAPGTDPASLKFPPSAQSLAIQGAAL
ncbi:MAG: hypothetical protein V4712_12470 [Pseudomonadota bacterium]